MLDLEAYKAAFEREAAAGKNKESVFSAAFNQYLISLYEEVPDNPHFQELFKQKESYVNYIIGKLKDPVTPDKEPDYFISDQNRINDYPSLFVEMLEYFCLRHEENIKNDPESCLKFFKEYIVNTLNEKFDPYFTALRIKGNFDLLRQLCKSYRRSGCQNSKHDKIKETLMLSDADAFQAVYKDIMIWQIIEAAEADNKEYVTFYDALSVLAESRGYKKVSDLYKEAQLGRDDACRINTDRSRIPSRRDIFKLILTLKLNIKEAERLMKAAGIQFSDSVMDQTVRQMIINGKWSLDLYVKYINYYHNLFYSLVNYYTVDGKIAYKIGNVLNKLAKEVFKKQKDIQVKDILSQILGRKDVPDTCSLQNEDVIVDIIKHICFLKYNLVEKTCRLNFQNLLKIIKKLQKPQPFDNNDNIARQIFDFAINYYKNNGVTNNVLNMLKKKIMKVDIANLLKEAEESQKKELSEFYNEDNYNKKIILDIFFDKIAKIIGKQREGWYELFDTLSGCNIQKQNAQWNNLKDDLNNNGILTLNLSILEESKRAEIITIVLKYEELHVNGIIDILFNSNDIITIITDLFMELTNPENKDKNTKYLGELINILNIKSVIVSKKVSDILKTLKKLAGESVKDKEPDAFLQLVYKEAFSNRSNKTKDKNRFKRIFSRHKKAEFDVRHIPIDEINDLKAYFNGKAESFFYDVAFYSSSDESSSPGEGSSSSPANSSPQNDQDPSAYKIKLCEKLFLIDYTVDKKDMTFRQRANF